MGVEYRHYIVVNEPTWRPQRDTAARVETVLRQWALVQDVEEIVSLDPLAGHGDLTDASTLVDPGPGMALVYAGVQGEPVARIAGASLYDSSAESRYTMRTTLVVGDDYRVHWSSDSIYFELISPPTANGTVIDANDDDGPLGALFAETFPSEGTTSAPIVKAHVADHASQHPAWTDYQGFWRAALIVDFGKDLPAFVETRHALPAHEFVAAVAAAFRGKVAEIGEIY